MFDERWQDLTSQEKDQFQRICRKLLKSTFIVRDKDNEHRNAYYFASRNYDLLNEYFFYMGFDLFLERDLGVVMLRNSKDASIGNKNQLNRINLKKYESILLCILWTLYVQRMASGKLSSNIIVSFTEINLELEKYKLKEQFDRTSFENAFALFKRYNLIDINGKVGNIDCQIKLYPSLQFSIDGDGFKEFVDNATKRMKSGAKGMNDLEEESEEDE